MHFKISQFSKFEVLLLDCDHVERFQKSVKLETLYGFGRCNLRSRDISMEFGRPLTGHGLASKQ